MTEREIMDFHQKYLTKYLNRPRPIDYDRQCPRRALHFEENYIPDESYILLHIQLLLDQKLHTNDCREATTQWYLLHRYCSKGFLFTVVSSLSRAARSLTSSDDSNVTKNSERKSVYIRFIVFEPYDRMVMFPRGLENGIVAKKL